MTFQLPDRSSPIRWRRRAVVAALAAAPLASALAQFRVEVSGVGLTQLPIALVPFRGEEGAPQKISAIVRADGTLASGNDAGSIHRVGARVQGLDACNGWTFWHYADGAELKPIEAIGCAFSGQCKLPGNT